MEGKISENEIYYAPIELREVRPIALSIRLHIQHLKIEHLKSVIPEISLTLKEFCEKTKEIFKLSETEAIKLSRYIFEKEAMIVNGKIQYKENKNTLTTKIIKEIEELCTKGIKFDVRKFTIFDIESFIQTS